MHNHETTDQPYKHNTCTAYVHKHTSYAYIYALHINVYQKYRRTSDIQKHVSLIHTCSTHTKDTILTPHTQ